MTKTIDPMTRKEVWNVPEPYTRDEKDDCSYKAPTVKISGSDGKTLSATVSFGSSGSVSYTLYEDGTEITSGTTSSSQINFSQSQYDLSSSGITGRTLKIVVKDDNGAEASSQCTITTIKDKETKKDANKCT